jgi:hypothetical protein
MSKSPMTSPATLPLRRKKGLLIELLPEETIVYDTTNQKAHCLNRVAALVWKHCDGRTSEADLAAMLPKELDLPPDELLIRTTLEKLGKAGLLEEKYVLPASTSRREASKQLAKFGIAAAGALVATIAAPTVALAASGCTATPPITCCPPGCLGSPCGALGGRTCKTSPVCPPTAGRCN